MKRIIVILLVIALLIPCAFAEDFDLSALTFDQLKTLQYRVSEEIVSRPEWKEVTVPGGRWRVGEDIPEGTYSIHSTDNKTYVSIFVWGANEHDYETNGGFKFSDSVDKDKTMIGKVTLEKGWLIIFKYPLIFAPAVKPGF